LVQLITAVTRPGAFEAIKEALALFGVRGMTVTQVARAGSRGAHVQIYRGLTYTIDTEPSLKIELIVPNDEAPDLMHVISKIISTSDPDDGVLWNSPVDILARVRTGEYGLDAL
jgi:nitrogen regulatory protein P-II 1